MTKSFVAFRISATLTALAVLGQAITAGMLLSFPGGRLIHAQFALAVAVTSLATVITAVLVWRPAGGGAAHIGPAATMFALVIAQMALGIAGVKLAHVPLGVLLWGGAMMLLIRAWRPGASPESSGTTPAPQRADAAT